MSPSPPPRDPLPLQSIVYVTIRLLSIVGGIVALLYCNAEIAIAWVLTLGIANVVLIRLPSRWFGELPDSTNPVVPIRPEKP